MMNAQQEILILSGLPGSGKTTEALRWLAEDPDYRRRINYDEMREELFPGAKFDWSNEAKVKSVAIERAVGWIKEGYSIIVDNTNLTDKARSKWVELGRSHCVPVVLQDIDTPIDICVRRDRERGARGERRVGRAVIERMALFTGWIDWADYPGKFVVVDVDGTLADCEHRRKHIAPQEGYTCLPGCTAAELDKLKGMCRGCGTKPRKKDWGAFFRDVHLDKPIEPIIDLVRALTVAGYAFFVVSGRPIDQCGVVTEDWLDTFWPVVADRPRYLHLFMREGGDHRADTIIKQEILELLPRERIAYVIDDRPSVLRMWRENGLTTLGVGNLEEF